MNSFSIRSLSLLVLIACAAPACAESADETSTDQPEQRGRRGGGVPSTTTGGGAELANVREFPAFVETFGPTAEVGRPAKLVALKKPAGWRDGIIEPTRVNYSLADGAEGGQARPAFVSVSVQQPSSGIAPWFKAKMGNRLIEYGNFTSTADIEARWQEGGVWFGATAGKMSLEELMDFLGNLKTFAE